MTDEEAIALVESLRTHGIELQQRGRLLLIERGTEKVEAGLRDVIARHWPIVAAAVAARRQARRTIARAGIVDRRHQRETEHE